MKYGLVGHPLNHSMSPFIHKRLFGLKNISAKYSLYDFDYLDGKNTAELKRLFGYNVTIPYKTEIIKYLDSLDPLAKSYMSVNTVKCGKGYNTDVYGFLKSVEKLGATLSGSVLILGGGGVARMAVAETAKCGGSITLALRKNSLEKGQELIELAVSEKPDARISLVDIEHIEGEFDLLINCTPVGMYPDFMDCPVPENVIRRSKAVFDLIYNPEKTRLLLYAERAGIPAINGMYMLVCQAAKSQQIWNGWSFSEQEILQIAAKANLYMKKQFAQKAVVFIGFMASGKTTVAKAVAKESRMPFVDIDEEIIKRYGSIEKIFAERGEESFRKMESAVLAKLCTKAGIIVSAGGGLPMQEKNRRLMRGAKVIYIDTPFELCYARILGEGGRPVAASMTKNELKELYDDRAQIYRAAADFRIDGSLPLESKVSEIMALLKIK